MKKNIMRKQSLKKQLGLTFISWIVVLAFLGFQGMVLIKVMPAFANNQTIKNIWKGLEQDMTMVGQSPKGIKKMIKKKMKINNFYDFDMKTVTIKKSKGYHVVKVKYEPRGTIIGPVDYIMTFEHEALIKAK